MPLLIDPKTPPGTNIQITWTAVSKGCFSMNGYVMLTVTAPAAAQGKPGRPCLGPSPTHTKLMAEPWKSNQTVLAALSKAKAKIQSNREQAGHDFAFDDFSITIEKMPPGTTPEQLLERFARDPNATAENKGFDTLTTFKRRGTGAPAVGTIYDIDIPGNPGSVMIVQKTPDHFVVQTITVPEAPYDRHPVSGAREFGFERNADGSITFYTRGADRPDLDPTRPIGRPLQNLAWSYMTQGLKEQITRQGGRIRKGSQQSYRIDIPTGC